MQHFNPCPVNLGQASDKIAKIHASVGGEIENEFAAVEEIFHADQFHRQAELVDELPAFIESLGFLAFVFLTARHVLRPCRTQDFWKTLRFSVVVLADFFDNLGESRSSFSLHNDNIADVDGDVADIVLDRRITAGEFDGYDIHRGNLSENRVTRGVRISISIASAVSLLLAFRSINLCAYMTVRIFAASARDEYDPAKSAACSRRSG